MPWLHSLLPQQEAARKENKTTTKSLLICQRTSPSNPVGRWKLPSVVTCWPPSHKCSPKAPRVFQRPHLAQAPGPHEMKGSKRHLWGPSGDGQGAGRGQRGPSNYGREKMAVDPAGHSTVGGLHRLPAGWSSKKEVCSTKAIQFARRESGKNIMAVHAGIC